MFQYGLRENPKYFYLVIITIIRASCHVFLSLSSYPCSFSVAGHLFLQQSTIHHQSSSSSSSTFHHNWWYDTHHSSPPEPALHLLHDQHTPSHTIECHVFFNPICPGDSFFLFFFFDSWLTEKKKYTQLLSYDRNLHMCWSIDFTYSSFPFCWVP